MDVILHVGAHQTATATLQDYLRRNRAALLNLRLAAWEPERLRGGLAAGLIGAAGALTPVALARAARSGGLMRLEMARMERAGIDRLLVSDADMIGSARHNLHCTQLYPALIPRLARMAGIFAPRCSRVLLTIRSYDSYWASAIATALPGGLKMPDADMLDRLVTQPRRWCRVVEDLADLFPRAECVVMPFEALMGRTGAQLAAIFGEPLPELGEPPRWLGASPGRDRVRQVLADRRERQAAAQIGAGDGRWQMFQSWHIDSFRAQYAEDLAWLRAGADGRATLVGDVLALAQAPSGAVSREQVDDNRAAERAGLG